MYETDIVAAEGLILRAGTIPVDMIGFRSHLQLKKRAETQTISRTILMINTTRVGIVRVRDWQGMTYQ